MWTLPGFYQEYFRELSIFYFIFGACVGSFLNVCIWRIPQGQSIIVPGSYCPSCKSRIRISENIPIVSWLILQGRCRYCRSTIPAQYILVELTTAWVFLLLWYRIFINSWPLPVLIPFSFVIASSIAIAIIDYKYLIIPNKIIFVGLILGVIWGLTFPITHQYDGINRGFDEQGLNTLLAVCVTTLRYNDMLISPILIAATDISLGVLLGGGVLLFFGQLGKLVWGKKKTTKKNAVDLIISAKGLQIRQKTIVKWSDLFIGDHDKMKIYGKVIQFTAEDGHLASNITMQDSKSDGETIVKKNKLILGGESFSLDTVTVKIRSRYWVVYQEVMGMGDVKFMAMLGAFLGPTAVLFIISVSSFVATLFGFIQGAIFRAVLAKPWPKRIPLGPFISLAAIGYIFIGKEVIQYLFPM